MPSSSSSHPQKLSSSGKPLPALGLKWGRSPQATKSTPTTTTSRHSSDSASEDDKPDFSTYYPAEEQERLRAKGVNPELKAEMEWHRRRSQGKGFCGKVAGTAMGSGWIK